MNKLFSFLTKNESHHILRFCAKVFRVIYIVLSIGTAIYCIITGTNFEFGVFIAYLILGILSFAMLMFIGIFIEALILGFSNVVENHFEELVLKNKTEDKKENFYLNKKQKAGFESLEKFNELRKSGAITEEEFEAKKKEYLDKM
ncbi:MAG: SHOCT domain-containing protein [Bacilli bacterium]|nr:SHOCT domain-containing protein [Bacilli bacterium]